MKKKMFGGHVHSPSKSIFTPPLWVNVENPDHSSAPVECRRQDSMYEMKNKMFGGMSIHVAKASSLHLSESTWRIQITHQPQWRVAIKTLSKKWKRKCLGGISTHLARASSLHLSESTWRIQITHQPQWRVAFKTLRNEKGNVWGACPLT